MTTIEINNEKYTIDLDGGQSLAIELSPVGPRAWYVGPMRIAPVLLPYVTGSVALGGSVNFFEIAFNPHGHGTHTETVGHIAREAFPISALKLPHLLTAELVTIQPEIINTDGLWQQRGDLFISMQSLQKALGDRRASALIVRTLPNGHDKKQRNYSGTNFCYFEPDALAWLAAESITHLLVDLPSVDREEDGGLLLAHRAFWQYPQNTRVQSTITEMIYVPDTLEDGTYLLHLSYAPFANDASPSVPTVFKVLAQS
jgi:arylformamidase